MSLSLRSLTPWCLSGIALFLLLGTGCEKRVEIPVEVHDTTIVRDTLVKPASGPAFVRFIRMPASQSQGDINLFEDRRTNLVFSTVTTFGSREYFAFKSDTSFMLHVNYYYQSQLIEDSIIIPSLAPQSLQTVILFQPIGTGMISTIINDSAKMSPAPQGMAYVRFLNGLSDFPQPEPILNVFLDSATTPLLSRPVAYGDAHGYVLVPAGLHRITLRAIGTESPFRSEQQAFREGGYYTARLSGLFGNEQFNISPE